MVIFVMMTILFAFFVLFNAYHDRKMAKLNKEIAESMRRERELFEALSKLKYEELKPIMAKIALELAQARENEDHD